MRKKYLMCMAILSLTIFLISCSKQELRGDLPPLPVVTAGEKNIPVVRASYCWHNVCADTAGPPEILEVHHIQPTKVSKGEIIKIIFDYDPKPTTVAISLINSQKEIIQVYKDSVFLAPSKQGVYYYDVFAKWLSKDQKFTEGDSYYAFVIEVE
jgi:hypothetical protein